MNKFKEFDLVKTPEDWKEFNINQQKYKYRKKKIIYKATICFLVLILSLSSVGIVYAFNSQFRQWVQEQFQSEEVEVLPQNEDVQQSMRFEDIFLCMVHGDEEIIDQILVFQDGQYAEGKVENIQGEYQGQNYSFDYVRYQDHIYTFHEKGYIVNTLNLLNDDILYFQSAGMNLCSLHLKTKEITPLTNDYKSVNFKISPNKQYITINKDDKYWTVYNTKTHKETRIDQLSPYLHNEEYAFFNDYFIVGYTSQDESCVIDLKTNNVSILEEQGMYPSASTFFVEFKDQKTILKDMYTHEEMSIPFDLSSYNYQISHNRYVFFENHDLESIVVIDFQKKKYADIDYKGLDEILDFIVIDDENVIITDDHEYYILTLSELLP